MCVCVCAYVCVYERVEGVVIVQRYGCFISLRMPCISPSPPPVPISLSLSLSLSLCVCVCVLLSPSDRCQPKLIFYELMGNAICNLLQSVAAFMFLSLVTPVTYSVRIARVYVCVCV
jgi:hypothetical protein